MPQTITGRALLAVALWLSTIGMAAAQALDAPTTLTVTSALSEVNLSWSAVAGATGYRISRASSSSNSPIFIDVGEVTNYTDNAVLNGTSYTYAVAARNALGTGVYSVQKRAMPGNTSTAPFLISPAHNSKPSLGMDFEWTNTSNWYYFLLIDPASYTLVYITTFSNGSGPCTGATCVLSPSMAGYPPSTLLTSTQLQWTLIGSNGWALGGNGNYNTFTPTLPEAAGLVVNWTGNTITLNWSASNSATSYHASFMNWAYVTSSEMFSATTVCNAGACSAVADVSQIPYGTVHVRLKACGANGVCSEGITSDAYKPCPEPMSQPDLAIPTEGSIVNGLTTLRWSGNSAAERYSIQFQKDDGGALMSTAKEELLWRSQLDCKKQADSSLCSRSYALSDGFYIALISAECGGSWGPQKIISFTVDSSSLPVTAVAPQLLSPAAGETTSIQPVMLWSKLTDIDNYELLVSDSSGGKKSFSIDCKSPICSFDYTTAGMQIDGYHSYAVRINETGMPFSAERSFTASTAYIPPAPHQTGPYQSQNISSSNAISIQYETDPQVPFSMITIIGPYSSYSTPPIPRSSCSFAKKSGGVVQRCSTTSPVLGVGNHSSTVQSGTLNTMGGGGTYWAPPSPPTPFTSEPAPAGTRAIYSVFAQNTQFLPATGPFGHGGGASSAWGLSDYARAAKLHDYISSKNFDVVVLSELFTIESQEEMSRLMKGEYPYFLAHMDTAGIASIDEAFAEQDSGLAIFSKFAPEYVNPGATSNYQGTSDTLNELDDINTVPLPLFGEPLASFKANDYVWWKQYGECEGTDCMAAKGFAGVRLANPKTGSPLFIGWTHTQSATDNITDSYEALENQIREDAAPVMSLMRAGAPASYDAIVLGDWNLNMPASVGRHPKYDGIGTNHQTDGGADLSLLYSFASVDDPENVIDQKNNPRFDALLPDPPAAVGSPGSGSSKTVYQQYRLAFDPRNAGRPFPDFYDLWLENPMGDPGLTFDVTGRRSHISCNEHERETCGQRHYANPELDRFDSGSRYDSVLARFSKSNIPNAPGNGNYPYAPSGPTYNWEAGSCVQHVSLARDYLYSDHFGTIIEVGPVAPQCNPATAKADPHLWRVPNSMPLPDPEKHGFDKEAGIHNGYFRHGGANEWFYIKDPGAFDIILEGSDPSMNGVIVEAFLANDLSDPIAIADATQHVDGHLPGNPACNQEVNGASIANPDPESGGVIADECAGADTRVTYRVPPGGLYLRIVPADPARKGKRCETCTGNYHMRFRERTCRAPKEAVAVSSGIFNFGLNTSEKGWFGRDQRQCWFQVELQAPTSPSDFQTLRIANVGSMSNQGCIDRPFAGGFCSNNYEAEIFKSKADAEANIPIPGTLFAQPATIPPDGNDSTFLVDTAWDLNVEPDTGRKAYYVRVLRDDTSRPHDAILNYDTDLKSVVFQVVATTDIEDDYITTLWLPFVGDFIVNDPFNNTDEDRVRQFVNDQQIRFENVDLNVDNQGGDYYKFPDVGPDGRPIEEGAKRGYGGTWKSGDKIGTWINYTKYARVEMIERDDFSAWDWVVADHLQCGKEGQTAPPGGWQAARFQELWNTLPLNTSANGNRFSGESFDYNDICGGDEGLVTWEYKFRAGVYRPQ